MRTWLVCVASDRTLDGPLLLHRDGVLYTRLIYEDCDIVIDSLLTCRLQTLRRVDTLKGKGYHNLD